jgi:hypothetical protein
MLPHNIILLIISFVILHLFAIIVTYSVRVLNRFIIVSGQRRRRARQHPEPIQLQPQPRPIPIIDIAPRKGREMGSGGDRGNGAESCGKNAEMAESCGKNAEMA